MVEQGAQPINIPSGAGRYILYQRTAYMVLPKTVPYKLIAKCSPWSPYNAAVAFEARFRSGKIQRDFSADMQVEYDRIRDHLPEQCETVLDIGCGVAGIDVLLFRHYNQNPQLRFVLLDKTEVDTTVFYGFKNRGAYYNALSISQEMLMGNGVGKDQIHLVDATPDNRINWNDPVDLVISLISWGFHYPVDTYVQRVHEILREGGHLILDVRKGVGGEDELSKVFKSCSTIYEAPKFSRILAIK